MCAGLTVGNARDRCDHAYRLLDDEQALAGCRRWDDVAVYALGLLSKPFNERGCVGNLAQGLRHRLSTLGSHDRREIIAVGEDQVEPATQELATLDARLGTPFRAARRDNEA